MGVAELEEGAQILWIRAQLFFYGDAASEALSTALAEDIAQHWNEPDATVRIGRNTYKVRFDLKGFYTPGLQPEEVYENDNPLFNYFRIEEYAAPDISFVDGLGSNTGYFKLANVLDHSTTAAHEFGHTLGLEHPTHLDIRNMGTPGIMYPRGTITDIHFQYDPAASPGEKGGTLNPIHRQVLQADIDLLQLHRLHFKRPPAIVGDFSSLWHPKHMPPVSHS